jgi:hypothetical protein
LQVKTGDDGKMFGSVTAGMIADQLKIQFDIVLDKRKIHLEHPIKVLGEHDIELRLHPEVAATLKVRVESTTPVTLPVETQRSGRPEARDRDKDGKDAAARTESRGHKRADRVREEKETVEPAEKAAKPEKKPRVEKSEKPAKPEKASKAEKAE